MKVVLFCDDKQDQVVTILEDHLEAACGKNAEVPRFRFHVADNIEKAYEFLNDNVVDVFIGDIYFEEVSQTIPADLDKIRGSQQRVKGTSLVGPILLKWVKDNLPNTIPVVWSISPREAKSVGEELEILSFNKQNFFPDGAVFVKFLEELS